jgi:hypothetical protein
VSECDREASIMRRPRPRPTRAVEIRKKVDAVETQHSIIAIRKPRYLFPCSCKGVSDMCDIPYLLMAFLGGPDECMRRYLQRFKIMNCYDFL